MGSNKSWIITIIAFAATILAPVLNDMGLNITEAELQHLLSTFLVAGGVGGGLAAVKHVKKKDQDESVSAPAATAHAPAAARRTGRVMASAPESWQDSATSAPFRTNLREGGEGEKPYLTRGVDEQLQAQVPKAYSYTTGILSRFENGRETVLQIQQSVKNNTMVFLLQESNGTPMRAGEYNLKLGFDNDRGGGGTYNTRFNIK